MDQVHKNYYEILDLPYDCHRDELEQSYIKAKNAYSNDSLALYSLFLFCDCFS